MTGCKLLQKAELPLEVVILLIAGMTMLIAGALLFPVSAGLLPYHENGLYGLLLVMFALQIITLGKTPFGDMRRSKFLLAAGVAIASAGIVTGVIPDLSSRIPRLLLFLCFGPGGLALLLQMFYDKGKMRAWVTYGGIFRHLIFGCAAVYGFSLLIALLLWQQSLLTTSQTAAAVLAYGVAIVYLACVLASIYGRYPAKEQPGGGDAALSTEHALLLLMSVFMMLLGLLLIPVNLGMMPFSGSAQLGLLMVMFAVQMLASGSTPIGPFPRSRLMILAGLLVAALGIVSSIIPGMLVAALTVLVGVLNLLGGLISLVKTVLPHLKKPTEPRIPVPSILAKLFATQLILALLSILFGTATLVSNLLPGLVIGVVLAANGCVLFYLLRILLALDKLRQ